MYVSLGVEDLVVAEVAALADGEDVVALLVEEVDLAADDEADLKSKCNLPGRGRRRGR